MSLNVCVTGAAGRISYSLIPLLLDGSVFGPFKRINLRLLDIEVMVEKLQGLKMEICDCSYSLIDDVIVTTDPVTAFQDADVAILLGGFPRLKGMERKDLIEKNVSTIVPQALALNQYAKPACRVIVVANPANTNCLVALSVAENIPSENFSCLTRLDQERLRGMVAAQVGLTNPGLSPRDVKSIAIFGNHSATQVPVISAGYIDKDGKQTSLNDLVEDSWATGSLIPTVQQRGAEVIKFLGASSALSAANGVGRHVRSIMEGIVDGLSLSSETIKDPFSMGILSRGHYNIPEGIVFSFPCYRDDSSGELRVNEDMVLPTSSNFSNMMRATVTELQEEAAQALAILRKLDVSIRADAGLNKLVMADSRL